MYSFLRAGNTFEYFHAVYDFEIFLLSEPKFGVGIFDFANINDAVGAVDYEVDLNSFPVRLRGRSELVPRHIRLARCNAA